MGAWLPLDLGHPGPGEPLEAFLALFYLLAGGDGDLAVKLVFVAAPLAAVLGAWFAAGAASRSVWVRAWVSLFYLASPALWASAADGRIGAVVAHAALPWAAFGLARALGANRLDSRPPVLDDPAQLADRPKVAYGPGSLTAAAGGALAFALATAGSPVLLLPGTIIIWLGAAFAAKGRRRRALAVPLLAWAMFAPLIWRAATTGNWRALLADPGLATGYTAAPVHVQLMGWPAMPALPSFVPAALAGPVAGLAVGAAVIAAVIGLFRSGRIGRAVRLGWLMAVLATGLMVAARWVPVGWDGTAPLHVWTAPLASLALAGWLMAAALGLTGLVGAPELGARPVRRTVAGLAVAGLVVGPVAGLALTGWQWWYPARPPLSRTDVSSLPAIAQAESQSDYATSTLVLGRDGETYTWRLARNGGKDMLGPTALIATGRLKGWPGRVVEPDPATGDIDHLVAAVVGRNPGDAARQLALDGIGFVLADVDAEASALFAALDATPGLARVSQSAGRVMWRVNPADLPFDGPNVDRAGRLHVIGNAAAIALPAGPGSSLTATLTTDIVQQAKGGGDNLRLVLAERADGRWHATLNGRKLEPDLADGWQQGFKLPSDAQGRLEVWWSRPWPPVAIQLVAFVLTALLALPLRRAAEPREDA
jgi:hypothetical protein